MQMQVSSGPASGVIVICVWMVIFDITAFVSLGEGKTVYQHIDNPQKLYIMQMKHMMFTNTYAMS